MVTFRNDSFFGFFSLENTSGMQIKIKLQEGKKKEEEADEEEDKRRIGGGT